MTSYDSWKLREPPYPEEPGETDDHYDGDPDGAGEGRNVMAGCKKHPQADYRIVDGKPCCTKCGAELEL
jgi:hypothetical protein